MSPRLFALCLVLVAPALLPAAEEEKEARALLDRAIHALGGKKLLEKHPALTGKSRGTATFNGMRSPVTNEWTVQGLDQLRWSNEITLNERATNFVIVLGRGKGWIQAGGGTANELQKEIVTPFQQAFVGLRIAESPVLLLEKGWKLSTLGELKVNGKAAVGIKAARKGLPEIDLYLDKATHFPIKAEVRVKESAEEATYTGLFAEYKTFAGRKCFTRLTVLRKNERVLEMERSDIRPLERQDDATFGKP